MGILKDIFGISEERKEYLSDVNSDCIKYTDEDRYWISYGVDADGSQKRRKDGSDPD